MSQPRPSRPRRRLRRRPEVEPEVVVAEMEEATQRLREQAWKINAVTSAPMIPEDLVRGTTTAESQP